MSISVEFLRDVCKLNPSPWDDVRYILRSPTLEEFIVIPEELLDLLNIKDSVFSAHPDQGKRGTCVGWANSGWIEYGNYLMDDVAENISAEDMYNKARKYDMLPGFLEGSNNFGAMKALHKLGVCLESCWPTARARAPEYINKFGMRKCESNAVFKSEETLEASLEICREAIEKYYGEDALQRL